MIKCTFENGNEASLRHVIVDALILKDDKILLVKRTGKLLEGGKWALVGGFVDRDETIEEAIHREVLEETGWKIKNPKLLRIVDNPNRPNEDRQNIAFVYVCEASEQVGKGDWENDEMKWFSFDQLPEKEKIAFDHFDDIEFFLKKEN